MEVDKVFCPSKAENGEPCGYELIPRFNVCPICGAEVDKSWFRREFSDVQLDKIGNTDTSASSESGNPVTQNEDKNSNIGREITKSGEKENAETNRKKSANKEIVGSGEEGLKGEGVENGRENVGNRKRKKGEEDEDNNGGKCKETRKEDIKEEAELEKEDYLRKQQETHGDGNGVRDGKGEKTRRENKNQGSQGFKNNEQEDRRAGRMTGTEDLGNESTTDRANVEGHRKKNISDPNLRSSAEGAGNPSVITVVNQQVPVSKEKEHLDKQNTQTSNKTGEHSDNSSDSQAKKTVKVRFHAFLAPTVDFNQKRDQLFVAFGPERNNWNCEKEGLMKFTGLKSKKKYGIPVCAEIELEKDLLKNNGLSYRYCFQRKVGGSNKVQEETEFLFQKFYPYSTNCRMLTVPPHLDYYQQYDGFIYVKKGGYIVNLFKDTFGISNSAMIEVMKKDGEHALKQYLPNVCGIMESPDQDPSTIITAVTEYFQVFRGGVKDQFMLHRSKYTPELWKQFIMDDHLRRAIEALNNNANKTDRNGRLLKALLMVKLIVDLNINMDFLDPESVETLHHSLLLAPDTENSLCPQLEFLKTCFVKPSHNKDIRGCLVSFLKVSAKKAEVTERNPSWITCLPIIHFLDGSLHPFEGMDYASFQDKKEDWWIISEFKQEKEELKNRKWSRSLSELMNWLKPLFILDTKTQRSFMACIKLEDLEITLSEENILLEIKLATMQHYFEICQYHLQMNVLQKCTYSLCAILQKQLMEFPFGPKREWNEVEERFKIQEDKCMAILSNGMLKRRLMSDKRCLVSLFHSDILTLAVLGAVSENSLELKSLEQRSILLIDEILLEVGRDITVFDFALSIMQLVKKNDVIAEWERKCLMHAKKLFETIDIKSRVELYIKSFEEAQNESLKGTIQEVVMECISDILQDPSTLTYLQWGGRFWRMDENIIFLSKLFSQMWTISSSAEITDDGIIDRALSSPFFPKCVEAYLLKKEVIQRMDETAQHRLSRSVSLMESLFKKLLRNEVRIVMLELITSKKETFLAVAQVFENFKDKSLPLTSSALENIVSCREKDLKRLQEVITTVQKLQFFFREISENSKIRIMEIDERKLQNWRSLEIGKVCAITEESGEFGQYQPDVILFSDLISKLDFIVKNISCYNDSKTFHKILKNVAQLHRKSTEFHFEDVIDKILIPTTDTWDEICNKMKTGSISVSEIEKYCFNDFTDDQLYNELVAMNRGRKEDWIKDRITQLQRFRMFSKTVSVAKLLLKVRDEYDINGSFENLELIAKSDTDKDISLVDLKMSIEKFNQKLEKINENQKKSIASFTKAKDIVQWMRSALPGGIKDLKIYADLALLSVEGDEHVGRVTHLHSAAIGYSSMIFGDINGEVEMINTWKVVWQNLEKDQFLPKKLEDSNRVLNWFIEIKEAHGSVEVTSLKQVDAIKDRGIFKVGNSGKAVKNSHQLDLQDVIWLHVPAARFATNDRQEVVQEDSNSEHSNSEDEREENDRSLTTLKLEKIELEGEGRDYTLGEMTDLQSRLMLVTGKADAGRESIERFTSIFDNVTRLGKVFLQLQTSGCILFKSWTFEFHCNPNAGSSVMIRTHEHSVVKGTNFPQHDEDSQNAYSNVNEYIRKIADFMESCYEEWIDYIAGKRKVFYPLNFYTVDQMVLLQEEIARYRNGNQVSQFLGPLLSVVKSHCSLNPDLDDAINKVQENLLAREQTSEMENESEKNTHTDAIRAFLQVAEGTGVSLKHALRAIQSQEFDIADTDAGLIWCMSNDEKDDEEEYTQDNTSEINTSAAKDTTFGDKLKEFMEELEENMRQQEVAQVILNLDVTWKKFLSCVSSSATDFLSIEHLGMILDVLYKEENCILKRTLIDPLKCGKPNLIVCPQREVIPMVLSIYMIDPNIPLPSRNEVLLCTDHTTEEEVERFVGAMLFNMLILGSLIDESGYIFHRSETDLYIVETTLPNDKDQESEFESSVQLLNILPSVRCISPEEVLRDNNDSGNDVHAFGFDEKNFQSDEYQRPYHYLMHYENRVGDIPVFNRNIKETDKKKCLQVLTRHCCVENPSWAELKNFFHFLNNQLQDFEKSVYCSAILQKDLPGFPFFVLRNLIQMSKGFSTRSLDISEGRENTDIRIVAENNDESSVSMEDESHYSETDEYIKQFQMRRKWETSAHPYLFFNPDSNTQTFIGFNIDKYSRNLVDQQTGMILERNIMSKQLWGALRANNVPLQENFNDLSREQKIERLCRVVRNDFPQDPDETYELTTDNVKKMMAIYMRFRCNIPVSVMGETGCGKTCLIKFLCSLQCPAGVFKNTMTLMKVHGGTTKKHIIEKVKQAESLAESNCRENGNHIITVLFFDEANTTEAVGCIKEIMCDGTIDGQPLALNTNLKLVAACNPYRKHSDEMIDRLERAGLGYHVNSDETGDKLGRIPMRHLVYRVQPLPQSMLPLVWDFGQLDNNIEKLYIIQMVQRCVRNGTLPPINRRIISILSDILAASQEFMRNQKDECSFVSLRDVERTLKVFGWMYNQTEIFDAMDDVKLEEQDDEEDMIQPAASRSEDAKMTKALLLALGVCYHSSLKSREEYIEYITDYFASPLELSRGAEVMKREITRCQMAFLQIWKLNDNIANNLALRENFFMMVVCVELRIPLFLVGKPGSSKSLSKTILDHNMQGRDSDSSLFKSLNQVQLISFQCSPLAAADGILKTFNQASSFQKSKKLEKFVSVVVLDEVGLAEDSPRMPLKALHPLLEDGCPDDKEYEDYKKVSFIGISNWALDPEKMNRGILVQRELPDEHDLIESVRGICEHDDVYLLIEDPNPRLAQAYLHVFNKACNSDTLFRNIDDVPSENLLKARQFFGLRDFYSLVQMICAVAVENHRSPTPHEVIIAIKMNFGGLEGLEPVQEFGEFLPFILQERPENRGVKTDTALLRECLQYEENKKESMYILLLTENYGALHLLHHLMGNEENTHVIFGSSFPRDQEYIEICRNINRIKVFMETGKTVVLLNLENLYESLYDALNQYYMESGPDRYIDLGLGTLIVKCKVDKKFSETIRIEEVFIGYNKDTTAGVALKALEICSKNSMEENRVLEAAKHILLWGCTPDAVLRLNKTEQEIFAKQYMQIYFKDQCHESLCDFLQFRKKHDGFGGNFIQITTHSKLMSETDKQVIERKLPFLLGKVSLLSLQAFDTEQQFSNQIREISQKGKELLLIQCDTGDENSSLVECTRYCVQRELQTNELDLCVIFLVHLSRVSKSFFSGFQAGRWTSVHIDELRLTSFPCIQDLMTKSISAILQESLCSEENFSEEAEYESAMVANLQERHVNLRTVLLNCTHPALASITKVDDNQERSIKRIKFIFKELNKSNQLTGGRFGYCPKKHNVTILSKHSADSILYNESWIQSEAAMSTSVNKTGTLRASCQRIIEDRVTPLLAKIVPFVDTNNNLSILESSDREVQWLTDLRLGIFSSIDVEILIKIKVPQVMNTGANHLASATFPFSWLIYEAVEQFLLVTSIEKSAEELFQKTEIGHFVLQHLAIENLKEATRLYMSDFVKMSHKASCSREEMIVCEFLHVCFEEYMAGKEDNFTSRVFCIHKTFRNIKPKLEIFSEVMCFVPQGDGSFYQKVASDIKKKYDARRNETGANKFCTSAEMTDTPLPPKRLRCFQRTGPEKNQKISDARRKKSDANMCSTFTELTDDISFTKGTLPIRKMHISPLFLRFIRFEGTDPENDQQTMQKKSDAKRKESDAKKCSTFTELTDDIFFSKGTPPSRNTTLPPKRLRCFQRTGPDNNQQKMQNNFDARRKKSDANKCSTFTKLTDDISKCTPPIREMHFPPSLFLHFNRFEGTGPENDQQTMQKISVARRKKSDANKCLTFTELTDDISFSKGIQPIRKMHIRPLFSRFERFEGTGPENNQQTMQKISDARRKKSDAKKCSTFTELTDDIFFSKGTPSIRKIYIPPLFSRFERFEGTGPDNYQQTMQKMPDEKRKGSETNKFLTLTEQTNDITSLNYSLNLKRSTFALCSQFLPCAGGSDLGDNQQKEQAGSDIYQHTLRTVSHCPSVSDYMQRATDKCAEVCTNNIKDGSCSYHCMRDSYKTSLVEFCAKPKLLFDFCPEYDPIGQTIQKDIYTRCKPSNPLRVFYRSSDLSFCDPSSCLQLHETGVRTGLTNPMTDATPVNGDINDTWLSQYWYIVLLLGVALISCIVLGCIFRLRRRCMCMDSRKRTKKENPDDENIENKQACLYDAA